MSGDTFTTRARYEWEGDSYYDALVYAYLDGVGNWHHLYDGLGTTRQLLDDNQAVTDTYQCEAFGNSMGATGSTPNPYRYLGSLGYYATGSSLMHLGARYYLPEVGRFVSQDPVGTGANWYAYGAGNAVSVVDPDGLFCIYGIGLPVPVRYIVGGVIMVRYYDEMRERNWIGADAYYHCLASCKAARCAGPGTSLNLGILREVSDAIRGRGRSNDDIGSDPYGISGCPLQSWAGRAPVAGID